MRAFLLLALGLLTATTLAEKLRADEARHVVEGRWGLELFADMTCAANPVQIDLSHDKQELVFSWPKSVEYDGGVVADGVTFSVTGLNGRRLSLRRDRDGVKATIVVSADGKSFSYEEEGPGDGSRFDRCEDIGS